MDNEKQETQIDWTKYSVSFWLKFCEPLPETDEKDLKDRSWQILKSELGDME